MCEGKCGGKVDSYGKTFGQAEPPNPIDPHHQYDKGGINTRDFIEAKELNYSEGCITKYIVRHKAKDGKQDLEKAMNYLSHLIDNYDTIYNKEGL